MYLKTTERDNILYCRASGRAQHAGLHGQLAQTWEQQITSTLTHCKIVQNFLLKLLPYYYSIRVSPMIIPWVAYDAKENHWIVMLKGARNNTVGCFDDLSKLLLKKPIKIIKFLKSTCKSKAIEIIRYFSHFKIKILIM